MKEKTILEAITMVRARGRPRVKIDAKVMTLYVDGPLLAEFDALCQQNQEKSRTAVIEELMRLYIAGGHKKAKLSKEDILELVRATLDKML